MSRRKKTPQRRGPEQSEPALVVWQARQTSPDQPSATKRPRQNRRNTEEEEEATTREMVLKLSCQLMKELGLDEERWQPMLPRLRGYTMTRVYVVKTTPTTSDTWHPIGQVKLQADVAGISNVLNDHVHTGEVEFQLHWFHSHHGGKEFLAVTADTRTSPLSASPLAFYTETSLDLPSPADSELSRLCKIAAVQLHLSLPLTDPSHLNLTVKVGEKLLESERADAVYHRMGMDSIIELVKFFYPEAMPCQEQELLNRQCQQSSMSCL